MAQKKGKNPNPKNKPKKNKKKRTVRKVKTENGKGTFSFKGLDGRKYRISLKEKKFCLLYLLYDGNGTEAAFEVYTCKNRRVAAAVAYENLRKPHIFAYIDLKLDEYGFNDDNAKRQHLFVLNQMADLGAKNRALDMYYKLKGKYAAEEHTVTSKVKLTDEQFEELVKGR